ncbi:anti-sigma regulatory factor (Ser/Thr protein kinase) [Crossiella equi]|uniref:Anti-sigma regulatory factor (Ser/Thr protein kinase) n=1 Tax=Crossiella equi TaxID=130796 RepID=A0ABS5AR49_9PSEU|nr:ATP-binding protein [Crossiella equi]MBP2478180.1 anti-sigma regulatory factor (Ser/Thr protein kinase) [Crossiella equi]
MSARPAESSIALEVTSAACRQARVLVRDTLTGWDLPAPVIEDAMLVASELVANVVDHANGPLRLEVRPSGNGVLVRVSDGSGVPPVLHRGPLDSVRQRGLQLVEALSVRWGHTPVAGGKIVWAELAG